MNDDYIELDVRQLVTTLLQNWSYIVGAVIISIIVVGLYSINLQKEYESTALLIIPEERYQVALESFVQAADQQDGTFTSDFTVLATSASVMEQLSASLKTSGFDLSPSDLEELLTANNQPTSEIIELKATASTPDFAANIVNLWAEILIVQTRNIYNSEPGADLARYNAELVAARENLDSINAEFIDFQATNRFRIVQNQLDTQTARLQSQLDRETAVALKLSAAEAIFTQLSAMSESTASMELSILQLQLQDTALSSSVQSASTIAFTLQNPESITVNSLEQQREQVSSLISALQTEQITIREQVSEMEKPILSLQRDYAELQTAETGFSQNIQRATDEIQSLVNIISAIQLTASESTDNSQLKLISQGYPNANAVSPLVLVRVILAGIVATILSTLSVLLIHWWSSAGTKVVQSPTSSDSTRPAKLRPRPITTYEAQHSASSD